MKPESEKILSKTIQSEQERLENQIASQETLYERIGTGKVNELDSPVAAIRVGHTREMVHKSLEQKRDKLVHTQETIVLLQPEEASPSNSNEVHETEKPLPKITVDETKKTFYFDDGTYVEFKGKINWHLAIQLARNPLKGFTGEEFVEFAKEAGSKNMQGGTHIVNLRNVIEIDPLDPKLLIPTDDDGKKKYMLNAQVAFVAPEDTEVTVIVDEPATIPIPAPELESPAAFTIVDPSPIIIGTAVTKSTAHDFASLRLLKPQKDVDTISSEKTREDVSLVATCLNDRINTRIILSPERETVFALADEVTQICKDMGTNAALPAKLSEDQRDSIRRLLTIYQHYHTTPGYTHHDDQIDTLITAMMLVDDDMVGFLPHFLLGDIEEQVKVNQQNADTIRYWHAPEEMLNAIEEKEREQTSSAAPVQQNDSEANDHNRAMLHDSVERTPQTHESLLDRDPDAMSRIKTLVEKTPQLFPTPLITIEDVEDEKKKISEVMVRNTFNKFGRKGFFEQMEKKGVIQRHQVKYNSPREFSLIDVICMVYIEDAHARKLELERTHVKSMRRIVKTEIDSFRRRLQLQNAQ